MNPLLIEKPITLVYGRLCSGKGQFCKNIANQNTTIITTSDIVRFITGYSKRSTLTQTKHLDTQILNEIKSEIQLARANGKNIVVDGIRQKQIVEGLINEFGNDKIRHIWLDVDQEELRKRFDNRRHIKDDQMFEEALYSDNELGVEELYNWLIKEQDLVVINHRD